MQNETRPPMRFPCSVCHAWLPAEAFGKPQKLKQPIVCDTCRKAIQRENDDQ